MFLLFFVSGGGLIPQSYLQGNNALLFVHGMVCVSVGVHNF